MLASKTTAPGWPVPDGRTWPFGERAGARFRSWSPVAASSLVALVAAAFLAQHLAPRYDEFHTLAYLQDSSFRSFWDAYRDAGDTLPPAAYGYSWLWSRVLGTSILAVRVPTVVAWAVTAGAVAALTRRAGAWASFTAGLIPTATSLVFLGSFARPYASALACAALGLWAWERAGRAVRPRPWLIACGLLFAASSMLHYATAAVGVIVALVALLGGSEVPHRLGRTLAPAVGGVMPVLLSAWLIPQAASDQGRLDRSVRALDAVSFWPSALRSGLLPLAAAGLLAVMVLLWPGDHRRRMRQRSLDRELVRSGWVLMLVVPAVTVAAMAVTSGIYVHRYAMGALLGAAIVVAEGLGRASRRWSWAGVVGGVAVILACVLAVRSTTADMVSASDVESLRTELALTAGGPPVVVIDEYDYLLLRHAGGAGSLALGTDPVVAHSPAAVDLDAALAASDGDPIEVVGSPGAVEALVRRSAGWTATPLGEATYVRPEVPMVLVHARLVPPDAS